MVCPWVVGQAVVALPAEQYVSSSIITFRFNSFNFSPMPFLSTFLSASHQSIQFFDHLLLLSTTVWVSFGYGLDLRWEPRNVTFLGAWAKTKLLHVNIKRAIKYGMMISAHVVHVTLWYRQTTRRVWWRAARENNTWSLWQQLCRWLVCRWNCLRSTSEVLSDILGFAFAPT